MQGKKRVACLIHTKGNCFLASDQILVFVMPAHCIKIIRGICFPTGSHVIAAKHALQKLFFHLRFDL